MQHCTQECCVAPSLCAADKLEPLGLLHESLWGWTRIDDLASTGRYLPQSLAAPPLPQACRQIHNLMTLFCEMPPKVQTHSTAWTTCKWRRHGAVAEHHDETYNRSSCWGQFAPESGAKRIQNIGQAVLLLGSTERQGLTFC